MSKKIVTNLRIDQEDWLQIKAMAAELGLSVNEYVNYLIKDFALKRELTLPQNEAPIWELGEISKKIKPTPKGKLSSNDELIYE